VYGCETFAIQVKDIRRIVRAENIVLSWMCGVRLGGKIQAAELMDRLGVLCVEKEGGKP